ncbi:MAG: helix-turn-helix domain-containing protein [Raineya sp.]|jgi:DNA-binding XRE family transcriptional regulator|nr:helix-turn-helix domain-containing protein [Raineya sp.]
MSQVSKNIRYLRRLHDYTQEEFAELLGIKRSSLGAYEEGRATPNFNTLMQLGKLFNLTIEQIVSSDISTIVLEPKKILIDIEGEDILEENDNKELLEILRKEEIKTDTLKDKVENKNDWKALEKENVTPEIKKTRREEVQEEIKEKFYPTLDDGLFSVENQVEHFSEIDKGDIPFVKQSNLGNYLANYTEKEFIEKLPKLQISLLAKNQEYRAFEMDRNFPLEKSICIGSYLKNWYNVQTGETYLFLTQKQGLVYGKADNRLRNEGYIRVQGIGQEYKILIRELFEIWQFQLFVSAGKIENI